MSFHHVPPGYPVPQGSPDSGASAPHPPFPSSHTALGPSPALMGLKPSEPSPSGLFLQLSIPPYHRAVPSLDTDRLRPRRSASPAPLALLILPLLIKPEHFSISPLPPSAGSQGVKAERCNLSSNPSPPLKGRELHLPLGRQRTSPKPLPCSIKSVLKKGRAQHRGEGRPDNRRVFGVQTFPFQNMDTGVLCTPVTEARSLEGAMTSLKPGVLHVGNPDSGQGRAE